MISAAFIIVVISFGSLGIFGAGGNKGTLGINDGKSGKTGGDGINGNPHKFHIFKFKSTNFSCAKISKPNAKVSSKFKDKSISGGDGIFGN